MDCLFYGQYVQKIKKDRVVEKSNRRKEEKMQREKLKKCTLSSHSVVYLSKEESKPHYTQSQLYLCVAGVALTRHCKNLIDQWKKTKKFYQTFQLCFESLLLFHSCCFQPIIYNFSPYSKDMKDLMTLVFPLYCVCL